MTIFFSPEFQRTLTRVARRDAGATVFAYPVEDPQNYGVVELDSQQRPISLQEKPSAPRSELAVTGLYFYDNDIVNIAAGLRPSARGELEITDVNREYLRRDRLHVEVLPQDFAWLDTGTHESLLQAAELVQSTERQRGLKIACLEEVAYRQRFINAEQLAQLAREVPNEYGQYLLRSLARPPESQPDA